MDYFMLKKEDLAAHSRIPIVTLGDAGEVFYEMALDMINHIKANNEAGKETVGQGLAIYLLQYDLLGELVLGKESRAECLGELVLEAVAHKAATQHCTAALIAEDVAQWGGVGDDLLTII